MLHWLNVFGHTVNLVEKFDIAKGLLQVSKLEPTPGYLDRNHAYLQA